MTHRIDQKIVGFAVRSATDAPAAGSSASPDGAGPSIVHMNETLARPEVLVGSTYKLKPGGMDHAMYVTINDIVLNEGTEHEMRRPFEIFINSKNMDQFQWVVALTRIMSAVFRKGGDVTFLVEEMKAVFDPKGGYWKPGTGVFVPSVIAEIGLAVEDHLQRIGLLQREEMSPQTRALIEQKRAQAMGQAQEPAAPGPGAQAARADGGPAGDAATGGYPPGATQCAKCHQKAVVVLDGCATCLSCGNSKCG